MFEKIINLLFPPKCGFCGKINKNYICKKCELNLNYLKKDKILKMLNEDFTYHLYAYQYKNEIRDKIINFKFNDKPELANTFANILLNNKKICRFLEKYDIMVTVPMYNKKRIMRGYNQSELIAKKIVEKLKIQYAGDVIKKCKQTKPQSSLNANERKNNLKDVYEIENAQKIKEKRVILFDDIYTTGSTARECSKILKNAGAKEIAVLTLAKD